MIISINDGTCNWRKFDRKLDLEAMNRVEKLVIECLSRLPQKEQYMLFDKTHNYQWGEGVAMNLRGDVLLISGVERDVLYPFAVFPSGDIQNAAEYFVWLVGKGEVKIDWKLFL
jgi:hypothetical protein